MSKMSKHKIFIVFMIAKCIRPICLDVCVQIYISQKCQQKEIYNDEKVMHTQCMKGIIVRDKCELKEITSN